MTYSLIGVGILVLRYVHEDSEDEINQTEGSFLASTNNSINSSANQTISEISETQRLLSSNENNQINTDYKSSLFQDIQQRSFFKNRINSLFLIIYIYFSNICLFGLLNTFDSVKYFLLGFFAFNNFISTILLSIFKQSKAKPSITFRVI